LVVLVIELAKKAHSLQAVAYVLTEPRTRVDTSARKDHRA
jgi:hypothetical protein